jgi:alpha-tubulin suppressor-like RCC1 family protein/pimeloyl-ACP methyl ester carboxylesterase
MKHLAITRNNRTTLINLCALLGALLLCCPAPASQAAPSPAALQRQLLQATQISAGNGYTCAISNNALYCWGRNSSGRLGDGTTTDKATPTLVSGVSGVQSVSAGSGHTCALVTGGQLYCWGDNYFGQLGDGTTTNKATPTLVSGVSGVQSVSAGFGHTCALVTGGQLYCWGENWYGQLGDGTSGIGNYKATPTLVSGVSGVQSVSAGDEHTCALVTGGQLYCWGDNGFGQLGDGTTTYKATPTLVSGVSGVQSVSAGFGHTCALVTGGQLYCWGWNNHGQLGDGSTTHRSTPTLVSGVSGVQSVSAGDEHTCALVTGGQLYCWGENFYGQLGDGTTTKATPTLVSGVSGVQSVSAGNYHTCALVTGGQLYCWGYNSSGQLGDGTTTYKATPTLVLGFEGISCTAPFYTPIIFLPGIMGSVLTNTVNGQEKVVWPDIHAVADDNFDWGSPLDILRLQADGVKPLQDTADYTSVKVNSPSANGNWDGVVQRVQGNVLGRNIDERNYNVLYEELKTWGYRPGCDLWAFPYDWRKAINTTTNDLSTLITQAKNATGSSQVYLVAHSMGGLVARQYIAGSTRAANVKGLALIGTPILGAPKSVALLEKLACAVQKVGGYCLPRQEVVQDLIRNFPAFYALMPSQKYFELAGGFYTSNGTTYSYTDVYTANVLGNSFVPSLHTSAKNFQDALWAALPQNNGGWNNVPVTLIGGTGQETIVGISQSFGCYAQSGHSGCYNWLLPTLKPTGDGTVPEWSISLQKDSTNWRGSIPYKSVAAEHTALTQNSTVFGYIKCAVGLGCPAVLDAEAATATVNGAQIIAWGAKAIHVTDASGNHTGPSTADASVSEQAIPGSFYHSDTDYATVALIGGQTYTIVVEPNGQGPVDIRLIRSSGETTTEAVLYTGVAASAATRIRLVGDPYVQDNWQVDVTGNGSNVQPLAPSASFATESQIDSTAPNAAVIQVQGTLGPNGWYTGNITITITGTDNTGGSGINRIEYAFSNQNQTQVYTGPFVVNAADVSVLNAVAVDNAGNTQQTISTQRIGADKIYLPSVRR